MIVFTLDNEGTVKSISKQLGEYSSKAPTVLRKAVNDTAKNARKMLAEQAQSKYAVQKRRFNKNMTIKSARGQKLEAFVIAKGKPLGLIEFKTSPKKPPSGEKKIEVTKAKVLLESSMKRLEMGGIKAFVVQFKNGHIAVAQRKSKQRLPIKSLFSPSIPKMIGNEKQVYGIVEPKISELLEANIHKHINKTLEAETK